MRATHPVLPQNFARLFTLYEASIVNLRCNLTAPVDPSHRTMATASHTAAGPSTRQNTLQAATLVFQSVLDDDQRREMLMMRQGSVPDAGGILMFTA